MGMSNMLLMLLAVCLTVTLTPGAGTQYENANSTNITVVTNDKRKANMAEPRYGKSVLRSGEIDYGRRQSVTTARCRALACSVYPADADVDELVRAVVANKIKLIQYHLTFADYPQDENPLRVNMSIYYKGDVWVRTSGKHGKTLLTLAFNYDILSLMMLAVGTQSIQVNMKDKPVGCLATLPLDCKMEIVRNLVLTDFVVNSTDLISNDNEICNPTLKIDKTDGYGTFSYDCCHVFKDDLRCNVLQRDVWIEILNVLITIMMYFVILFAPLWCPKWFYRFAKEEENYIVKLPEDKPLTQTLMVTSQKKPNVHARHRFAPKHMESFRKMKRQLKHVVKDKPIRVEIPTLDINVEYGAQHMLGELHVPVGLMNFIYRMFFQCKIAKTPAFITCCKKSVLGNCCTNFPLKWLHIFQLLGILIFIIFILPFPFWIRLLVYIHYEQSEIMTRKTALAEHGFLERFEHNPLQYLTPTHPLYITAYSVYFVSCFLFVLAFRRVIGTGLVERVVKESFEDLNGIEYRRVLRMLVAVFVLPLESCGCCGIILGLLFWPIALPVCVLIAVCYFLPIVYLSFRMLWNSQITLKRMRDKRRKQREKQELRHKLRTEGMRSDLEKAGDLLVSVNDTITDEKMEEDYHDFHQMSVLRRVRSLILHFLVGLSCLVFIYSVLLMLAEIAALLVQVFALTLMGAIVNAGATLKYMTLVVMICIYSYDAFNGVYKTYLALNKALISDVFGRVKEINEIRLLPSYLQHNQAFKLPTIPLPGVVKRKDRLSKTKARNYHLTNVCLFLDKYDNPRIPRKLFDKVANIEVAGAPGPVYKRMWKATIYFLTILLFLVFVFIVVAVFGDIYNVSSTNQVLATLAGGFIPFFLRSFLKPPAALTGYKSTLSWKSAVDEVIAYYHQNWPISDINFRFPAPQEETEDEAFKASEESSEIKPEPPQTPANTKNVSPFTSPESQGTEDPASPLGLEKITDFVYTTAVSHKPHLSNESSTSSEDDEMAEIIQLKPRGLDEFDAASLSMLTDPSSLNGHEGQYVDILIQLDTTLEKKIDQTIPMQQLSP